MLNNVVPRLRYIIKKILICSFNRLLIALTLIITVKVFAIEENYKELKQIEKKLKYNKEILLDLRKIENELNNDIRKIDKNLKRYQYMIKKGFYEKNKVAVILNKENKKLIDIEERGKILKDTQKFLIENAIVESLNPSNNLILSSLKKNIYSNITSTNKLRKEKINTILKSIEKRKLTIGKLDDSLSKIRKKLSNDSVKKERILGETVITAIQKEKNKFKNKRIKNRAKELKKLIERLEKNKFKTKDLNNVVIGKFKNILPVGKLSIEKISTDKFKKGILFTLKNDSILKAPREAIVVYADNFKGYGNMVILDLGNEMHLIFSGLSNILCKTGDWVQKGVILGDISKNFTENSLYMEVRFKGKTISPTKWANS